LQEEALVLVRLPVPVGKAVYIRVAGPGELVRQAAVVVVDTSVAAVRVAGAICLAAVDTSGVVVAAVTADDGFGLFF
jgi:hypothetical protein